MANEQPPSLHTLSPPPLPLDTCWKRIGIEGDRSCEQLPRHVHCRNCERYAQAAIQLLDRYPPSQVPASDQPPESIAEHQGPLCSALVFRLGQDWLAINSRCLLEVAAVAPIHSLPHQRSKVLLGVGNVRGALVPCLSLTQLLGLSTEPDPQRPNKPRHLILATQEGALITPVDEVDAVQAIPQQHLQDAQRANSLPASQLAQAVITWQGRSLTWLDEQQLLQAMQRSLT